MAAYRGTATDDLTDTLYNAVREQRRLSGDERRTLKSLISNRVRELVPYEDSRTEERTGSRESSGLPLSQRECEVLVLLMLGNGDQEIADELQLSHHTVKSHVARILEKLEARNRVHATAIVLAVTSPKSAMAEAETTA